MKHITIRRRGAVCTLALALLVGLSPASSAQNEHTLPLVLPASGAGIEGFVRVVNLSDRAGTVRIHAIDDTGERFGPVTLALDANETVNFKSRELEQGNAAKGLPTGVGDGEGYWRLELESGLDIGPLAYVRTADGFVTSMHDLVSETGDTLHVLFFNPGSNRNQVSRLRLVNRGAAEAEVTVTARDDAGECAPGGEVRLTLPAGAARMLSARDLESGGGGFDGSLGDGAGKWRLFVSSSVSIEAMSLLTSPTGHLANLSTAPFDASAADCGQGPTEPGTKFRDCPECPEMVVVPAGSFMMGSPESEWGRFVNESPVHRVTIGRPFAVGVYEVTLVEWDACVSGGGCGRYSPSGTNLSRRPVIYVGWNDAKAYVEWLSRKTGEEYRLLSESEWEYVARAGTGTARYWGESETGQCRYANGADASTDLDWRTGCNDGHAETAPVGTYEANGFGLRDVLGNVWEWVEDCWNESYRGAPVDGSAWTSGDCKSRMLRGGSWFLGPQHLRSAVRDWRGIGDWSSHQNGDRSFPDVGFRVARTLD